MRIYRKIVYCRLENFSSCDEYLQCISRLASALNATRLGHVDEQALAAFYMAGLPKEYDPFCQSIEASSETISADEVRQRIRDLYERKNQEENCDFGENSGSITCD